MPQAAYIIKMILSECMPQTSVSDVKCDQIFDELPEERIKVRWFQDNEKIMLASHIVSTC